MATESPLIHDGSQTVAASDYRRSSITGTTLNGANGSAQFLAVLLSTTAERTVAVATAAGGAMYGILQNTPNSGEAADVGVFGVSKAIAGSSIVAGQGLSVSTLGKLIPYSSAAGIAKVGSAIVNAAAGDIFTAFIYGGGVAPGSVA